MLLSAIYYYAWIPLIDTYLDTTWTPIWTPKFHGQHLIFHANVYTSKRALSTFFLAADPYMVTYTLTEMEGWPRGQVTIDIDEDTERNMLKMIQKRGISKSRWIAELIRVKKRPQPGRKTLSNSLEHGKTCRPLKKLEEEGKRMFAGSRFEGHKRIDPHLKRL